MENKKPHNQTPKWTITDINMLIDAYQDEQCLYASTHKSYHNKCRREEALYRVCRTMRQLRPTITPKECAIKFHALRNQFNIEHTKVRASLENGTDTDNIYQPALWYYEKLMFLSTYLKPRKSRNSFKNLFNNSIESLNDSDISLDVGPDLQQETATYFEEETSNPSYRSSTSNVGVQEASRQQPTESTTSKQTQTISSKFKKRKNSPDNDYAQAIHQLTEFIKQPIIINTGSSTTQSNSSLCQSDPVDSFASFIGSLLRTFQDEELKLELMNSISQTVIKAKSTDIQRAKK